MIESIIPVLLEHWLIALSVVFVAYLARNYFYNGLHKYPGPFLASFTDWWRFWDVLKRRPDITQLRLHRELGDIVRIGPNTLTVADPKALKTIYGLNKGMVKSDFYPVQQAMSKGQRLPSLFSTTDEQYHANLRRSVNSAFSMSSLVQYEPMVSDTTAKFLEQTEAIFASKNKVCDFALWLQYFAFDVIGDITYSKRHGFIDRNEDIDGMVGFLGSVFSYVAPVGQIPVLDLLLLKNPILRTLDRYGIMSSPFPVVKFAQARMAERLSSDPEKTTAGRGDLLSMFFKAKEDRPDFFTDERLLVMAVSMAFAGSETTAISLAAVFYYLLKNPQYYRKLVTEIDEAVKNGDIEDRDSSIVTWTESQKLPYLDACIKEALRMHPAAGLPLERVVPPSGIDICGQHIPGGTIIGANAWVIHRRPEIWGEDCDIYRPERWLEASVEKRKEMEGMMFQFGMGSRTCIGKNISLLEMYKCIPSVLRKFEVQLEAPEREWKLHNAWFVKQFDFNVKFSVRERKAVA